MLDNMNHKEYQVKHMDKKIDNFKWRTGRSCVFKNFIHLVFVTKYRRDVFNPKIEKRLREIFEETCIQMGVELIEFGSDDDHCHLMVCCPPKLAVSNLVGKLKGKSAYLLRKEFWPILRKKLWGDHLWSPSYCVVSCGGAPLDVVKQYITDQRKPPDPIQVKKSVKLTKRKDIN